MAKIKFGMMMTDARGKLGGQVFSKNRAGAYIRTKVTPSNPQSMFQSFVRSNLGTLSSGWNALSAQQIAEWNEAVKAWQSSDIFGDIKTPTGKNLFVKLNLFLLNTGQTKIVAPPEKMALPQFNNVDVAIDQTAGTINISGLSVFTAGRYQVEACAPVPRGVNYVKNKFRVITSFPVSVVGDVDVYENYTVRFGSVANAENIFFRIRAIGENGQASTAFVIKASFE